jgi:hypothetical protein
MENLDHWTTSLPYRQEMVVNKIIKGIEYFYIIKFIKDKYKDIKLSIKLKKNNSPD